MLLTNFDGGADRLRVYGINGGVIMVLMQTIVLIFILYDVHTFHHSVGATGTFGEGAPD